MEFFNVVSVDKAKQILSDEFEDIKLGNEIVSIKEALQRYLGKDIIAEYNIPEFNRSTVDGYAILVEDSHGASEAVPSVLTITGEVKMGEFTDKKIKPGQAIYVPTGGMLPIGATGMIMIEHTEKMDDETLLISKPITNGENVVYKAEDIKKGEIILRRGQKIATKEVGVLASLGINDIPVFKKPRVYIISTGDEIIDIKEELKPGKIRDINSYALESLVEISGGTVSGQEIIRDDFESLLSCVEKAIKVSDIVLLSGGSSVGTKDFTHKVINSIGGRGVFVHGLAIKPGKPTIIGDGKGKPIVGLPGHPVSSIVVYKAIIEPFIKGLLGNDELTPRVMAKVTHNFPSSPGKQTYHMVKLNEENGDLFATPSFGKSGMITLLSKSQGYIIIKEHEEGINEGELREVFLL